MLGLGLNNAFGDTSDPYRGLKVGVHTYSLRKLSFEDAIAATRGFGVKYVGLNPVHIPLNSPVEHLDKAKAAIHAAGLTLMAAGVVSFDTNEEKAKQAFDFARMLEMPVIVANPTRSSLPLLHDLVKEFDIRIAIHNHGPGSVYSTPKDVLSAIEPYDERIGACADLGHFARSGVEAKTALVELRDRLYDIHLKDVDQPVKKGRSVVLGQGIIDFKAVFEELLATDFSGHVALEYEGQPDDPIQSMNRCFSFAREVLASI